MKKKEYLIPELEILDIEISKMICASDGTSTDVDLPSEEETDPHPMF